MATRATPVAAMALLSLLSSACKPSPPATPTRSAPRAARTAPSTQPPSTCAEGRAATCVEEGKRLSASNARDDLRAAAALYDRGCALGALEACTALGHAIMDKRGVEADIPRAVTMFRTACAGGEPHGCFAMGRLAASGGIEALYDPVRAAKDFAVGCQGGISDACAELAIVTASGQGTTRDLAIAIDLAQRACGADSSVGCAALGAMFAKSAATSEASMVVFEKACSLGGTQASAWACARVAHGLAVRGNATRDEAAVKAAFDRACDAGLAGKAAPNGDRFAGCVAVGLVFEAGGQPVLAERDPAIAVALYSHACDRGSALGCAARGIHYERTGKKGAAMADYKRACAMGAKEACAHATKK